MSLVEVKPCEHLLPATTLSTSRTYSTRGQDQSVAMKPRSYQKVPPYRYMGTTCSLSCLELLLLVELASLHLHGGTSSSQTSDVLWCT